MCQLVNLYTYERRKKTHATCIPWRVYVCVSGAVQETLSKLLIYSDITNYAKAYLPVPVLIVR